MTTILCVFIGALCLLIPMSIFPVGRNLALRILRSFLIAVLATTYIAGNWTGAIMLAYYPYVLGLLADKYTLAFVVMSVATLLFGSTYLVATFCNYLQRKGLLL